MIPRSPSIADRRVRSQPASARPQAVRESPPSAVGSQQAGPAADQFSHGRRCGHAGKRRLIFACPPQATCRSRARSWGHRLAIDRGRMEAEPSLAERSPAGIVDERRWRAAGRGRLAAHVSFGAARPPVDGRSPHGRRDRTDRRLHERTGSSRRRSRRARAACALTTKAGEFRGAGASGRAK